MSHVAVRLVAIAAGTLWIAAAAATPADADPPGSGEGPRVGVVLFLSDQIPGRLPFDAGALHAGCWDQIAAAVHDLGRGEVSREEIVPLMVRWGVRTSSLVGEPFLTDVSSGFGADQLLIFDLILYEERLVLCGRGVRIETGQAVWADLEDLRVTRRTAPDRDADLQPWIDATRQASRRLLRRWSSCPVREERPSGLFLLPIRTEGLEEATGRMVLCCLLRSLLASSPGSIEDPGVTFSRLREAGIDPERLDPRARAMLGQGGAPAALLVGNLMVYGFSPDSQQDLSLEDEGAVGSLTPLPESALSLRLISAETGTVVFGATEYLDVPSARGLFGAARDGSLVKRIRPATDRLVHAAIQKG